MEKEYKVGDTTVIWNPDKCIHSAVCAKGLPAVFKPREKPWVQTDGASEDEIRAQVQKCPSKALSLKD